jgi:hypothetical protein
MQNRDEGRKTGANGELMGEKRKIFYEVGAVTAVVVLVGLSMWYISQKQYAEEPSAQKPYAVFDYEDFGPQAMAWESLGMQWWQWNSFGDNDPAHRDDVKVVVYAGVPLAEAKEVYPVDEARKQDYRYIAYDDAMKYLDRNIRELENQKAQWAVEVRDRLIITRERVIQEVRHVY